MWRNVKPSNIWHRDSNPLPLKHDSSPITTRPGQLLQNNAGYLDLFYFIKISRRRSTFPKTWKLQFTKRKTQWNLAPALVTLCILLLLVWSFRPFLLFLDLSKRSSFVIKVLNDSKRMSAQELNLPTHKGIFKWAFPALYFAHFSSFEAILIK